MDTYKRIVKGLEKSSNLAFVVKLGLTAYFSKFIPILIFFSIGMSDLITSLPTPEYFDKTNAPGFWSVFLIAALLVAPLLETLVFQFLIIHIILKLFKNKTLAIVVSAILFALSHGKTFALLYTFPIGIVLAWGYTLRLKRSKKAAFLTTAGIHLFVNILSSLFLFILY